MTYCGVRFYKPNQDRKGAMMFLVLVKSSYISPVGLAVKGPTGYLSANLLLIAEVDKGFQHTKAICRFHHIDFLNILYKISYIEDETFRP